MGTPEYISTLANPKDQKPLAFNNGQVTSVGGGTVFPSIRGIPWIYAHPQASFTEWQGRVQSILAYLQGLEQKMQTTLDLPGEELSGTTRSRIEARKSAYHHNRRTLSELLSDFSLKQGAEMPPEYQTIMERIPGTQHIDSYVSNLLRDWSWETNENQAHLQQVLQAFSPMGEKSLVVFGAGSSRLAIDVHQQLNPKWSLAVDINPYLLLGAQRVLQGEEIQLHDFPVAPVNMESTCPLHVCQAKMTQPENFHFLFADCMNPPFRPTSIDCIFTPWFLDIIPQNLQDFTKRMNHILVDDGEWVNFGPLGFSHTDPTRNLTLEELEEILTISGFKLEHQHIDEVPYLHTEYAGQKRIEKVLSFRARKVKSVKLPPKYNYLPEWIIDTQLKIPRTNQMERDRLSYKTYYEILQSLNGEFSAEDLIMFMQHHYKMTEEQARISLISFLIQMYEKS